MYLSKIEIKNYRNFSNSEITFQEGVNVIIGQNNSGKSNLLRALDLVIGSEFAKKPTVSDFFQPMDVSPYFEKNDDGSLKRSKPPSISISLIVKQSSADKEVVPMDSNTVYHWKVKIEPPYEARLTYKSFLPSGEEQAKYQKEIIKLIEDGKTQSVHFWRLLDREFIRKYVYRIYGGDESQENIADRENLNRFDFQFLNAIRDVEKELFSGQNTLLKDVLDYFLDHKLAKDTTKSDEEKEEILESKRNDFSEKSRVLIDSLKDRIDTDPILEYATNIGASLGGDEPNFEGEITEVGLFSALRLMIKKIAGFDVPVTHNGLGYNNLIYISVLLSKMQMSMEDYTSIDDQKVFPMLIVEEPEAHLHPSMQFKLLKFLKENLEGKNKKVRQVFVTTHSTHITSSVDLDEIICLNVDDTGKLQVAYPGRVFVEGNEEEMKSKAYVKRFLDATKSDMLFAKSVLLVEGLAEQLLMDVFVKYVIGKDKSLADYHTAVISVGGRYFDHFLKLFKYENSSNSSRRFAINKLIGAAIDCDPSKKKKGKRKACYPYEEVTLENDLTTISTIAENTSNDFAGNNIKIALDRSGKGKTLEYAIILENPSCKQLITSHMSNQKELKKMMEAIEQGNDLATVVGFMPAKNQIRKILESCNKAGWTENDKKKAAIASRYLSSVKSKGEHALTLYEVLLGNLEKSPGDNGYFVFNVPTYIKDIIEHVCK
jgi:predicted ATP-dependent endonuclease of OLD family